MAFMRLFSCSFHEPYRRSATRSNVENTPTVTEQAPVLPQSAFEDSRNESDSGTEDL
jgi:hypothetical protein